MHRYSGSDRNLEIRLNKINTICSKIMLFYSPIICNMPLPHDSLTGYCFSQTFPRDLARNLDSECGHFRVKNHTDVFIK